MPRHIVLAKVAWGESAPIWLIPIGSFDDEEQSLSYGVVSCSSSQSCEKGGCALQKLVPVACLP